MESVTQRFLEKKNSQTEHLKIKSHKPPSRP